MARKRDVSPEAKLQRLIAALEQDKPQANQPAMESLLHGPLICNPQWATEAPMLRAQLLAFLRSAVSAADSGQLSYSAIATSPHPFSFRTLTVEGRVAISVDGHDARDLVILQVVTLLQLVGLHNVRICRLPECRRMFIKTYRREFCSPAHQGLNNKREQREIQRQKRERDRRRRAQQKGA